MFWDWVERFLLAWSEMLKRRHKRVMWRRRAVEQSRKDLKQEPCVWGRARDLLAGTRLRVYKVAYLASSLSLLYHTSWFYFQKHYTRVPMCLSSEKQQSIQRWAARLAPLKTSSSFSWCLRVASELHNKITTSELRASKRQSTDPMLSHTPWRGSYI